MPVVQGKYYETAEQAKAALDNIQPAPVTQPSMPTAPVRAPHPNDIVTVTEHDALTGQKRNMRMTRAQAERLVHSQQPIGGIN